MNILLQVENNFNKTLMSVLKAKKLNKKPLAGKDDTIMSTGHALMKVLTMKFHRISRKPAENTPAPDLTQVNQRAKKRAEDDEKYAIDTVLKVLSEHQLIPGEINHCSCGKWSDYNDLAWAKHFSNALSNAGWMPPRKPMTSQEAAQSVYDNIRGMNPDEKLIRVLDKAEAEMHKKFDTPGSDENSNS